MTRAAVYLRISQDSTGEGLGVARQREDCLKLAEDREWDVAEIYTDNDVSATKEKARPAYRQLLADIEAGLIDAIICWHADRLYRRMRDLEELLEVVQQHNTQIATVKAGTLDLTTDSGRLIAEILASVAGYEGRAKATRWKRSWQQGREAGRFPKTGNRMFGYTRDGEVIPTEAAIARWMAEDIAQGGTLYKLANQLHDRGILTTKGLPWRPAGIKQYLTNPRLIGLSTLKGEIVGEGDWEPLLDRDLWETARAVINSRSTGIVRPRRSILTGLIFCGLCGHRLITGSGKGKRTYRCPKRTNMEGCGRISGNAEPIEEIVEAYARARFDDPRVRQRIAELRAGAGSAELLSEIASLEARLLELDAELDEPGVPVKQITRAIARTQERLDECQARLAQAAVLAPAEKVSTGGSAWPTDLAARRALVELALGSERIYLDKTTTLKNVFDPARVRIEVPSGD